MFTSVEAITCGLRFRTNIVVSRSRRHGGSGVFTATKVQRGQTDRPSPRARRMPMYPLSMSQSICFTKAAVPFSYSRRRAVIGSRDEIRGRMTTLSSSDG